MSKKNEFLTVECFLSDEEKIKYSKEMADTVQKKARKEDDLKAFSTQAKAEIALCDSVINAIASKLASGKEYKSVECRIVLNFEAKEKSWVRLDTGEVVKTDIISEKDLQQEAQL